MLHCWRWALAAAVLWSASARAQAAEPAAVGYFPAAENQEAWRLLPRPEKGGGGPLPAWARVMVRSLPATTAAMLELDYLHRAESPLDPKLRGKMRWAAAHANRCPYSEACAFDDLKRAGLGEEDLKALREGRGNPSAKERKALDFARKMMTAAYRVTDEEVADLIELYGEKQVVAMVLMLAHASFQDRIILSLGLGDDRESPLAPVAVKFSRSADARKHLEVPARKGPARPPAEENWKADRDWLALDYADLRSCLGKQKERKARIRVPTGEELNKLGLSGADLTRTGKVVWSSVTRGYQPELAAGWGAVTRSFREESGQDPVFSNSVFWVVTRSLQCFY